MAIDTSFILGYGGWAQISLYDITQKNSGEWHFFPMTSATITRSNNVGFASTYHVPFSDQPRSKIRLNKGIYRYSGSINFQFTQRMLNLIFQKFRADSKPNLFFSRIGVFDLRLCDGQKLIQIPQCMWSSFSFNVNPNAPIQCSISFESTNGHEKDINIKNASLGKELNEQDQLQKYWNYGNSDGDYGDVIQNFSLSFSRPVTSVYLNNQLVTPTYLRSGVLDCSASISCNDDWLDYSSIILNDRIIQFLGYYKETENWQFVGNNGIGIKDYVIRGSNVSTNQVFQII